jgi:hypothetical protein
MLLSWDDRKAKFCKETLAKKRIRLPARYQIKKNCPEKQTENSWNLQAGMKSAAKWKKIHLGLPKNGHCWVYRGEKFKFWPAEKTWQWPKPGFLGQKSVRYEVC